MQATEALVWHVWDWLIVGPAAVRLQCRHVVGPLTQEYGTPHCYVNSIVKGSVVQTLLTCLVVY
jgi:hypothetical protein